MAAAITFVKTDGEFIYLESEDSDTPGLVRGQTIYMQQMMQAQNPAVFLTRELEKALLPLETDDGD